MVQDRITAADWLEESVPVEAGGTLYIGIDGGSVSVVSHAASEVRIEAEARGWGAGMVIFSLERRGNDVEFDGDIDAWFPLRLLGPRLRVRAWVPPEYSVEVESRGGRVHIEEITGRVHAETRGGHMGVKSVRGPVLLRTGGGHIKASDIAGDLRARTSGGHITLEHVEGDVETRTHGGHIKIRDAGGEVDARTSGGHIMVSFSDEPWGRLETSAGHITVDFPGDARVDLDARSSAGRITLAPEFGPAEKSAWGHLSSVINGGGAPLVLRTSAGHIRVGAR